MKNSNNSESVDQLGNYHITIHGYPRYHSGPHRNQYVHRVAAANYIGRQLRIDEQVHHRNGNKLDWSRNNLIVMGQKEHGWVSSLQHWYMKQVKKFDQQQFEALLISESQDTDFNFGYLAATTEGYKENNNV